MPRMNDGNRAAIHRIKPWTFRKSEAGKLRSRMNGLKDGHTSLERKRQLDPDQAWISWIWR